MMSASVAGGIRTHLPVARNVRPAGWLDGHVLTERLDPRDLDLDTAEVLSGIDRRWLAAADLDLPAPSGPSKRAFLQLGFEGRPKAGLLLARHDGDVLGYATLDLPDRENRDSAHVQLAYAPDAPDGTATGLLSDAVDLARAAGRTTVRSGTWEGSLNEQPLASTGFTPAGQAVNAVRRIDLHGTPAARWQRLYDEAGRHAADYELVRLVGPTPDHLLEDMTALHAAINDAPPSDADAEPDVWDADRVASYDRAMAGRRQTVHRVLARHRATGSWAGISIVCVDEFAPSIAFQEDTSVVRAHRGHRLGLLMKADMLRWITDERPEVAATDTWNDVTNHHMIAVNEVLGAGVVARHRSYRLQEDA
jgi:hypothetical protein